MNTSLIKIAETTNNDIVLRNAAKLISAGGRKVKVQFVKKDGSLRTMICSLRDTWNGMNGFETTKIGLKMLKTKIGNGVATVTEWLGDGKFQPRSIPLAKITSLEFV